MLRARRSKRRNARRRREEVPPSAAGMLDETAEEADARMARELAERKKALYEFTLAVEQAKDGETVPIPPPLSFDDQDAQDVIMAAQRRTGDASAAPEPEKGKGKVKVKRKRRWRRQRDEQEPAP